MSPPNGREIHLANDNDSWNEHAETIIRTISYHQRDFALSLISFPESKDQSIHKSLLNHFPRAATADLGRFDKLSLEVLHNILLRLDMRTVFAFRHLNLRSRQIFDSVRQYQLVVKYGLTATRALLQTGLATRVSLSEFSRVLCSEACQNCSAFGAFVFLPTWQRCCFPCIEEHPGFALESVSKLRKTLKLKAVSLKVLPSFKTLPGRYGSDQRSYQSRMTLSPLPRHLYLEDDSYHPRYRLHPKTNVGRRHHLRFMGSCQLPALDNITLEVDLGVSCAGCQLTLEEWYSENSEDDGDRLFQVRDKVYSRSQFLEHFRHCENAQRLWSQSEQGTVEPSEMPAFACNGGWIVPDKES